MACSASPSNLGEQPTRRAEARPSGTAPRPSLDIPADDELLTAELSTIGWDQLSGSPVVLLRELDSGQTLPIWIGMAEARAISFELHDVDLPRPMTHDLMTHLLETLGAELEEMVVSDLRQGTYYGLLKLRILGETEPRWIDTRPSDGLALALRTDATIRVAKKLIEELPDYQFLAPESPDQVVRALGLTVVNPNDQLRTEFALPERRGLVVIATSGEAKRKGMARGDLITKIEGLTPTEPLDLLQAVDNSTGSALTLVYWRDGEEVTVELSLSAPSRPKSENIA
ncbi:MAG: bifunctional nuclease domain-containing protein [Acidobacteriota bacterium]